MAENERLGLALFSDSPDVLDRCVRGEGVVVERPGGFTLLDPLEGDLNPGLIDDLVHQNVRALRQSLEIAFGIRTGVAREDH
jgi:hypothetical protein